MRIHHLHAVLEPLCHTINHVLDVAAAGLDGSQFLRLREPLLDLDGLVVDFEEIDSQMLEVLGEATTWSRDFDHLGLDLDSDVVRHFYDVLRVHDFHG